MSNAKCTLCLSTKLNIETWDTEWGELHVHICNDCGFQYIDNANSILGREYFTSYYNQRNNKDEHLNKQRKSQYKIDAKIINQHIGEGDNILDVGCSYGGFIEEIHSTKNNVNCFGIDVDTSAIYAAKNIYSDIANFQESDLLSINDDIKFDLIIFRGTFQYLGEEVHESMRKIHNLLKNNGKVIIFSLPSTDSFFYSLLREKWALFHPEMSLMFNERSLRYLMESHKFKIDELEYPYLNDVYSDIESDYLNIKNIILGRSSVSVPFWGSVMSVVASKNRFEVI